MQFRSGKNSFESSDHMTKLSANFMKFLEEFPEAVIIHDGQRILHVNPAALDLFGAGDVGGLLGMPVAGLLTRNTATNCLSEASNGAGHRRRQMLPRLDGTLFHGEVSSGSFMYNGRSRFFAVVTNVERWERAEEELISSEKRYRDVVQGANSIILRFDAGLNITFMNRCGLDFFGYEEREIIGKKVMEVIAPSSGGYVKSIIADIYSDPNKYPTHENEVIRRDGSRAWISWTNRRVFDETGRFREILSIGNDITKRKAAEDAVLTSRELLKSMGAELSMAEERERQRIATEFHDLIGQNLALAKIKLDALLGSPDSSGLPGTVREVRELLTQAIQELRSQIFRISPPVLHLVGLEAAVEALCEKYQADWGICVVFIDDGEKKTLQNDLRGTVYTMVRELLLNVAKHSKAKNVVVTMEKLDDNMEIRVEDDGIGFDPVEVCRPSGKKSCLGLFSIKQRIEYLGGMMNIDSAAGRGCRITLLVPLHGDQNSPRKDV